MSNRILVHVHIACQNLKVYDRGKQASQKWWQSKWLNSSKVRKSPAEKICRSNETAHNLSKDLSSNKNTKHIFMAPCVNTFDSLVLKYYVQHTITCNAISWHTVNISEQLETCFSVQVKAKAWRRTLNCTLCCLTRQLKMTCNIMSPRTFL